MRGVSRPKGVQRQTAATGANPLASGRRKGEDKGCAAWQWPDLPPEGASHVSAERDSPQPALAFLPAANSKQAIPLFRSRMRQCLTSKANKKTKHRACPARDPSSQAQCLDAVLLKSPTPPGAFWTRFSLPQSPRS